MSLILSGTDGLSDVDGSAATPAIRGTDANTGMFFPAADTIAFSEGGTEVMRINSSGNVGIGTNNPVLGLLDVNGASSTIAVRTPDTSSPTLALFVNAGSNGVGTISVDNGGIMTFDTGSTGAGQAERMRIDASGNVGIGTTSPGIPLGVVSTSAGNATFPTIIGNRGTTVGTQINIGLQTYDSGSAGITNAIGSVTTSASSGAGSADMVFLTTASATRAERMRITSGGNVSIGTTSSGGKLTILDGSINVNWANAYYTSLDRGITILSGGYADTTNKARIVHIGGVGNNNNRCGWTAYSIKTNTVDNGAEYIIRPVIWNGSAFTEQGSAGVYLQDNATSWSSASDERLKENLKPITDAITKVDSIRAVTGKYKTDSQGTSRAFLIAQDVQKVLPEAVSENSEGYLGLAYTDTIPLLVAAIKELNAKVEAQAAEIALLKSK